MNESDKELLMLAAKPCGMKDIFGVDYLGLHIGTPGNVFNPLEDDGQALRLAVTLHMEIRQGILHAAIVQPVYIAQEITKGGRLAATRRAITRAAAEIGRAME